MVKKSGCKKGEIKFRGDCYPKNMTQSEHAILDWVIDYAFKGNKLVIKNISDCITDPAHVRGKCAIGAIIKKKTGLANTIDNILKKAVKKTEDLKIPDKQWKSEYNSEGKERSDYIETIKVGNSKYDAETFFGLLNEALDDAVVTKSKQLSKKLVGEKIKVTFWQDKQPDGPIIIKGKTGLYALAPRIESK